MEKNVYLKLVSWWNLKFNICSDFFYKSQIENQVSDYRLLMECVEWKSNWKPGERLQAPQGMCWMARTAAIIYQIIRKKNLDYNMKLILKNVYSPHHCVLKFDTSSFHFDIIIILYMLLFSINKNSMKYLHMCECIFVHLDNLL